MKTFKYDAKTVEYRLLNLITFLKGIRILYKRSSKNSKCETEGFQELKKKKDSTKFRITVYTVSSIVGSSDRILRIRLKFNVVFADL